MVLSKAMSFNQMETTHHYKAIRLSLLYLIGFRYTSTPDGDLQLLYRCCTFLFHFVCFLQALLLTDMSANGSVNLMLAITAYFIPILVVLPRM